MVLAYYDAHSLDDCFCATKSCDLSHSSFLQSELDLSMGIVALGIIPGAVSHVNTRLSLLVCTGG